MIYLRTAILTLLALVFALVGYIFFTFDASYGLNMALESFRKGQYAQSKEEIEKIANSFPKFQVRLYEAYIYRAENQWSVSDSLLEEAALLADQDPLLLEITLNQALNAYLGGRDFLPFIEKAQQIDPKEPWVLFLTTLEEQKAIPQKCLSGWMQKSFEDVFTPFWFATRKIREQIKQGKLVAARELLEKESEKASPTGLNEIHLLFGLSYVNEALDKPAAVALPYYKLAFSYFDQVPMMQEGFSADRKEVSSLLYKAALDLLEEHEYETLSFYLTKLENWKAHQEVQHINQRLLVFMNETLEREEWKEMGEISEMLARTLPEGEIRRSIAIHFDELVYSALEKGSFERLKTLWETARIFHTDKEKFDDLCSSKIQEAVLSLLPTDDDDFSKTKTPLTVWQSIEKDRFKRLSFAKKLLAISEALWKQEGLEQRALHLMKLAATLPATSECHELQEKMSEIVQKIYFSAERMNHVNKLPYLYEAVVSLKLTQVNLQDKKVVANYLADAQCLYAQKHYDEARKLAYFLLQLDPTLRDAQLIAGMSDYYFADYARALQLLTPLKSHDERVCECLAVCRILLGEQGEEWRITSEDSYVRLGLGLISQNRLDQGIAYLRRVTKPDNEVYAALCFAEYRLQDYEAAIDAFHQLTGNYRHLDGLQGSVILSLSALHRQGAAEEMLSDLMNSHAEILDKKCSPAFIQFKEKGLASLDRNTIAKTIKEKK